MTLNHVSYSSSYRWAFSLLQRKASGRKKFRRMASAFRASYRRCATCERRDEYAEAYAQLRENEVRR